MKMNIRTIGIGVVVALFLIILIPWNGTEKSAKSYEEEETEYFTFFGLCSAVGFPLKCPEEIPFDYERDRLYIKLRDGVGQIIFRDVDDEDILLFTQGKKKNHLNEGAAEADKSSSFVSWEDDTYQYSIQVKPKITDKELEKVVRSVKDWRPVPGFPSMTLKDSTEDEDLDETIIKLFAKADSAKPKLSVEPEDAMSICNEEAFLKWKDAEYLVGSAMEENNLVREDVLNLDDKKLANEGFEHYVLEDRSRFGIGIRRNAKGYENSVIVNWMTGADFDLTSPTNCGLILDNTDGKWTDQKIVWLICQYNYSHINFSKLPYPYDKYKALSATQKGWLFAGIFAVVVVVTFGDIFWRLRKK